MIFYRFFFYDHNYIQGLKMTDNIHPFENLRLLIDVANNQVDSTNENIHSVDFNEKIDVANKKIDAVNKKIDILLKKPLYYCQSCNFSTTYKKNLYNHNLSKHDNVKKFRCNFEDCNQFFKTEDCLFQHSYKHNKTKIKCDQCDKEYQFPSGLYSHKKKCHENFVSGVVESVFHIRMIKKPEKKLFVTINFLEELNKKIRYRENKLKMRIQFVEELNKTLKVRENKLKIRRQFLEELNKTLKDRKKKLKIIRRQKFIARQKKIYSTKKKMYIDSFGILYKSL